MTFKPVAKEYADPLDAEMADVGRRRRDELQRRARIFDPKVRTIGVDVEALGKMSQDKKDAAALERQRNLMFDKQSLEHSRILTQLHRQKQRNIRVRNVEYQKYRDQYQGRKVSRDYDLCDPDKLKNDKPPRTSDTEVLPASSLQMFSGEDLVRGERERRQKLQVKEWANAAIKMKEHQEQVQKEEDAAYSEMVLNIDEELKKLQVAKNTNQKSRNIETRIYNQQLAESVSNHRKSVAELEDKLGSEEVALNLKNKMLTEDRSTTKRNQDASLYVLSNHNYVPWHFKGYSAEERQSILDEQARQIEHKQRVKEAELQEQRDWDAQQLEIRRQLLVRERQRNRNRTQRNIDVAAQLDEQKKEFKQRYDYINNVVYTNHVDEYVFNCFGTTTR